MDGIRIENQHVGKSLGVELCVTDEVRLEGFDRNGTVNANRWILYWVNLFARVQSTDWGFGFVWCFFWLCAWLFWLFVCSLVMSHFAWQFYFHSYHALNDTMPRKKGKNIFRSQTFLEKNLVYVLPQKTKSIFSWKGTFQFLQT